MSLHQVLPLLNQSHRRLYTSLHGTLQRTYRRSLYTPSRFSSPTKPGVNRSKHHRNAYTTMTSSSARRRLETLEVEANSRAGDATAQAAFLSELGKTHPQVVIQRVESEQFAANDQVFKEYAKALIQTKRFDSVALADLLKPLKGNLHLLGGASGLGAGAAAAQVSTSEGSPVYVQMVEPGIKSQMWKTVRMLALGFIVITLLSKALEDGIGATKGLGLNQDVLPSTEQGTTFDDVKGVVEAKEELQAIVNYLKDPAKFTRLGGKLPKGVLLTGPPGTGKTLLAKAIAGEAGVPFFYASGSDFEEMYVGIGAKRVRKLFAAARQYAPCIVFIDEIDAIGARRAMREQAGMKMTLNQLLVELDGFNTSEGVIIVGATNFPKSLDPALVRPGRFDRNVVVPLPDVRGRMEILKHYLSKVPHDRLEIGPLARGTAGASGADLANLVNIAAIRASSNERDRVIMDDLQFAKDKIQMGAERKSAIIPDEVRKVTAYHEGGHAMVALLTKGAMPVEKATIIPRGQALGYVLQLPSEADTIQRSKQQLLATLDVCMGGQVAEELIFGANNVTTGASSDLSQATKVAREMVANYGMGSTKMHVSEEVSDETKQLADKEVKALLNESYNRVKNLLRYNKRDLHRLAKALLEHETLSTEQIKLVLQGKSISTVN